jgi:signal transduction histidine kinase
VLDNILDNAIRHAPDGSTITIEFNKDPGIVQCSISDQGPGIPAEHLPYIFERFYRVESARDRDSGGSGLGLAIARSLVEAQGGEIRVESSGGAGTRIIFHLPAVKNT